MLTFEHATPEEFTEALCLMKESEAREPIPHLSWDQEWAWNNYQDKDYYSIFKDGCWIGFLSLEIMTDALFIHTLQQIPEAQGNIWGYRVYECMLAKSASFGKYRIECNVLNNGSALTMYWRLGFVLVHTDKYLSRMQLNFSP